MRTEPGVTIENVNLPFTGTKVTKTRQLVLKHNITFKNNIMLVCSTFPIILLPNCKVQAFFSSITMDINRFYTGVLNSGLRQQSHTPDK